MTKWINATRSHRRLLNSFTCAPKPQTQKAFGTVRYRGLDAWVKQVQGMIRSAKPPYRAQDAMRIKVDDPADPTRIDAALLMTKGGKGAEYDFAIVAMARSLGAKGTGLGNEILEEFYSWVRNDMQAGGMLTARVMATVHAENAPAQRLLREAGWVGGVPLSYDASYEVWSRRVSL